MFNWVCPRCGHDVPPSKTECPFCFPPVPETVAAPPQQRPPQQYQPQPPAAPPQTYYSGPGAPPQYAQQQAPPPQYWQQPPQYQPAPPPQQYPPQYAQQPAPQQYWQPQPPQPQYQPAPPQYQAPPPETQHYQPPPPQEPPPAPQHYIQQAPPQQPQYEAPQYAPPAAEFRQPEPALTRTMNAMPSAVTSTAPTPWPPPEEQAGKPMWVIGVAACAGVLLLFWVAYHFMGSHGSSAAADSAAKQQTANPLQKYIEVTGVRIVSDKSGQAAKFLVINHSGVEMSDLTANVTLWAGTSRSDDDSIGSFTFHAANIGANESKEFTAPLKTEKQASDIPDWRNITADPQVTSAQ